MACQDNMSDLEVDQGVSRVTTTGLSAGEERVFDEAEVMMNVDMATSVPEDSTSDIPEFPALTAREMAGSTAQFRRVRVPKHRMSPLRSNWAKVCEPLVTHMKLQMRMNPQKMQVEIRTSEHTTDTSALQKGADFVKAFILGFEFKDAIALLRLDDLFIDSFMVTDVKTLHGEHLSRAIGRVVGQQGKTKFTIENATRTRIVVADLHIHILGSFQNIKTAKQTIVRLIMGAPPSKVYSQMKLVASAHKYRF
eukprot:56708_1